MNFDAVTPVRSLSELPPGKLYACMRPLKSNVPFMEGGTLTTCPRCGRECWKTPREPDVLPAHVVPRCTECALRIHLEYQASEANREQSNG